MNIQNMRLAGIGVLLGLTSSVALAWQPVTYPNGYKSGYQRSVDTASCYAMARQQTNVDITRQGQAPTLKEQREQHAAATQHVASGAMPGRPPLPPAGASGVGGTAMPAGTPPMAASGAHGTMAAAPATGASGATGSTTSANAAGAAGASATAMTGAMPGSGTSPAPGTIAANAGTPNLPPLPAPEPPMTQYWAAYGACMQSRGYTVMQ